MAPPPPGQTQLPDWDGLKLQVRTLIASHRVMIFSKSYCPYCNKVRGRRESPRRALLRGPAARAGSCRNGGRGGLSEPLPLVSPRGGGRPGEARDICPEGARSHAWRPAPGRGKCARGRGLESRRCGDAASCDGTLGV